MVWHLLHEKKKRQKCCSIQPKPLTSSLAFAMILINGGLLFILFYFMAHFCLLFSRFYFMVDICLLFSDSLFSICLLYRIIDIA